MLNYPYFEAAPLKAKSMLAVLEASVRSDELLLNPHQIPCFTSDSPQNSFAINNSDYWTAADLGWTEISSAALQQEVSRKRRGPLVAINELRLCLFVSLLRFLYPN